MKRRDTDEEEPTAVTRPRRETHSRREGYCPSCDNSYHGNVDRCPVDGTKLVRITEAKDAFIGRNIDDRFEVRAQIGRGGMGTVYRAWQHSIGREVAIKLIDQRHIHDRMGVRRFLREARLASQLSQPNTVSVIDFGQTEEGHLYLVMELLKGRTLDQVVREEGAFSPERTVRLGVQMCDALEAAHALSIVHRDLKPANVIMLDDPPGRDLIKVLDFGLAKSLEVDETESTLSGKIVGTPRYMAPEVALGEEAGPSADLYSLGAILHEVATARPLFAAPSISGILAQKASMPELSAKLPKPIKRVLSRLLDPEPMRRYHDAAQVRNDLAAYRATMAPVADATRPEVVIGRETSPATEVLDESVRAAPLAALTPPSLSTDVVPALEPARSPWRWLLLTGLIASAAFAGFLLAGRGDNQAERPQASLSSPTAMAANSDAAPTPVATLPLAPADAAPVEGAPVDSAQVELSLKSSPRASVMIAGEDIGRTPITHRIAASDAALEIRFYRKGYRTVRKQVTPNRDHAVDVALDRLPKKKPAPPLYPF